MVLVGTCWYFLVLIGILWYFLVFLVLFDTTCYMLLQVTAGYSRLLQVTLGYEGLLQLTTGYYRILHFTKGYDKWLKVKQCSASFFNHLPVVLLRRIPCSVFWWMILTWGPHGHWLVVTQFVLLSHPGNFHQDTEIEIWDPKNFTFASEISQNGQTSEAWGKKMLPGALPTTALLIVFSK